MIDLENIRNYIIDHPQWSVFGNQDDFVALPETHQAQIFFLHRTATKYLFSFTNPSANLLTGGGWDPFEQGNFRIIEECCDLNNTEESNALLKKWLYQKGLSFDTPIFILFEDYDHAILTTWKMLIKYVSSIFFSNDVVIFDKTLNWCLYYFHENQLFFGRDNQYNPEENERMMQALNDRKKNFPQFRHPYL